MSLKMRASVRTRGQPSCNMIFCRIVCLPRSMIGGFSRAIRRKRNQFQTTEHHQLLHPEAVPEERAFLDSFEHQYGTTHPFLDCYSFIQTLKIAEDDHKLMFLYLHSPEHPFTPMFCSTTLCSELVVQFLNANFVSWGAIAERGEGLQMAATLQPAAYPFCAVIAPAASNNIVVLQQMEGPIDPAELVEILQRTIEEQGSAFGTRARGRINEEERIRARGKEEEKLRSDRRLREEQDAAYFAALQRDQEKEKLRIARAQKPAEAKQLGKPRQNSTTQILIRFPSGATREQSFSSTDKILSVYRYIDSLGLPGIGNYRLISSYPKRVYSVDQMGMSLEDAGLYPRASLFVELI